MNGQSQLVWLVTGCSSGLGAALAGMLVHQTHHRIVISALDMADIAPLAGEASDRVLALKLDVTDRASVDAAVAETIARFGRLDVLVNNAGVGQIGALEELSGDEISRAMGVNFFGTLNMLQAVLPQMRAQRSGRILTLTSMGGFRARPAIGIYNASKFALEGAHEALAGEVATLGIAVTMIEPGLFRSGFRGGGGMLLARNVIADYAATSGQMRAAVAQDYPSSAAQPSQIAAAILAVGEMAGQPPLRLQLGSDAVAATREKLDTMSREVSRWETVADLASAGGEGEPDTYRRAIAAVVAGDARSS